MYETQTTTAPDRMGNDVVCLVAICGAMTEKGQGEGCHISLFTPYLTSLSPPQRDADTNQLF
jgi:hypothetical protein